MTDTIFAPTMPMLKSAVCIVRISGSHASDVLFQLQQHTSLPKPRYATHTVLYNRNGNPLDRGLVQWFPAPHSFTGEDVVELHLHGSIAVIRQTIETLASHPELRYAEPGEFSRRAFENGKMDLTEAEGLSDLIEAETALQASQALGQMQGHLKTRYEGWRAELITLMAQIEATIDFPEDDLPPGMMDTLHRQTALLQETLAQHLGDDRRGERLRQGIYVTLLGAPNVGKSTLLNQLSQRNVAIVSSQAGTTRDILEVHLDIGGYPFIVADTAGLRESHDFIEQEGIARAKKQAMEADIILALFDASSPKPDAHTLDQLRHYPSTKMVFLLNKIDNLPYQHLNASSFLDLPDLTIPVSILPISAETGEGINALLSCLKELAPHYAGTGKESGITRTRHRLLLTETLSYLHNCYPDLPTELHAENLRLAATALGKITGHIDIEDILDNLFRHFCIGK